MTDTECDLGRFSSREDLKKLLQGFDGLELMHLEEDHRGIISNDMVVGYHTSFPQYWLDFRNMDTERLLLEFDSMDQAYAYYGGKDGDALIKKVRCEYERAISYGAEYMVFHVSDASSREEMTGNYHYTDEMVVTGTAELLNEALSGISENDNETAPMLLLENLWQPGFRFTDPVITKMMLELVRYPRKGIMLDTGHLMHTESGLKSQREALSYIHKMLDLHDDLICYIKGIHLHQSVTGRIIRKYHRDPPERADTYEERMSQLFEYVFQVDLHQPFAIKGVKELVERISPEYLTYEFISNNLEEHARMLKRQQAAMKYRTKQEV